MPSVNHNIFPAIFQYQRPKIPKLIWENFKFPVKMTRIDTKGLKLDLDKDTGRFVILTLIISRDSQVDIEHKRRAQASPKEPDNKS